jgi:short subunit dehydrogenase-like uncharacterized protein
MNTLGKQLLIYGAYGYSGRLIVASAVRRGLKPIVAGRDAAKTEALARRFGVSHRVFSVIDATATRQALDGVGVVINCAGPFTQTAPPMISACIAHGAHYLDINGEWRILEAMAQRDAEFAAAGIMVMPSVGTDVVPSDCLALHIKQRLPAAVSLELNIRALEQLTRGTINTFVESLGRPSLVRRQGRLQEVPSGADQRIVDVDGQHVRMLGLPWGDVVTAWYSTRIPDIAVFMKMPFGTRPFLMLAGRTRGFWQSAPVQRWLKKIVQRLPEGPDDAALANGRADFVGTATDAQGHTVSTHLRTPEGYALTGETAAECARRVLAGEAQPGFRTAAMVFGADFILSFDRVTRRDLP